MVKLNKYRFDKLYKMSSGISSTPEQAGHGAPFVSFSTVFNNYYLPATLDDFMDTSDREQEIFSVRKGDILLTRTSETIDELGMSCVALKDYPGATFSGFVKRLRPLQDNVTYDKYMAFYLRSTLFRKAMENNTIMTLRASLNEEIFSYLELYLPDYETQRGIGNFLFDLESMIQKNKQINARLLSVLKALYEYWFVQFDFPNNAGEPYKSSGGKMVYNADLGRYIPSDWTELDLSNIISRIGTGLNPRNHFKLGRGANFYITIKNITNEGILFDHKCDKIDDSSLEIINRRSDLRAGDILFTSIEPVGITYYVSQTPVDWNINESVFTLRPNKEMVTSEYLYMLLSSEEMKSFTRNTSAGSIHKGIRHSVLKTFKLPYCGLSLTRSFSNIARPIIQKMDIIDQENRRLSELRDFLLPMLMNGQVTINNAVAVI